MPEQPAAWTQSAPLDSSPRRLRDVRHERGYQAVPELIRAPACFNLVPMALSGVAFSSYPPAGAGRQLSHGVGVARDGRRRHRLQPVLGAQPGSGEPADDRRRRDHAADHETTPGVMVGPIPVYQGLPNGIPTVGFGAGNRWDGIQVSRWTGRYVAQGEGTIRPQPLVGPVSTLPDGHLLRAERHHGLRRHLGARRRHCSPTRRLRSARSPGSGTRRCRTCRRRCGRCSRRSPAWPSSCGRTAGSRARRRSSLS